MTLTNITREEAKIRLEAAIAAAHAVYARRIARIEEDERSSRRRFLPKSERVERDRRIIEMHDSGMTAKDIGREIGLSYWRVREIFWDANFRRTHYPDKYDKYGGAK